MCEYRHKCLKYFSRKLAGNIRTKETVRHAGPFFRTNRKFSAICDTKLYKLCKSLSNENMSKRWEINDKKHVYYERAGAVYCEIMY